MAVTAAADACYKRRGYRVLFGGNHCIVLSEELPNINHCIIRFGFSTVAFVVSVVQPWNVWVTGMSVHLFFQVVFVIWYVIVWYGLV